MSTLAFMSPGSLGIQEMLIIVAVIALLFGAKRVPQMARAFGRSIWEFKKGSLEIQKEVADLEKDMKGEKKT